MRKDHSQRLSQVWAAWVVRHAHMVVIGTIVVCGLVAPFAMQATQHTAPDGWLPDSAIAVEVQRLNAEEFGHSNTTYYVLFHDPTGELSADAPAFVQDVQFTVRVLRAEPGVDSVLTWGTTRSDLLNSMLISDDRQSSLAVITLNREPNGSFGTPEWLRSKFAATDLDYQLTGLPVVGEDFRIVGHNDLVRAEFISLPITLLLLVVIFRGVLPALIPVALAAGSLILTLAAMRLLAEIATVNVFTVNTVTMLGLAVGIDYALIMVSRFREEYSELGIESALERMLAKAGHTVVVAGSTVAIGLSGLFFFDVPAATTTAILGAFVVLAAIVLSLLFVPAALVIIAPRISVGSQKSRGFGLLDRLERLREMHPVATLASCLVVIVLLTAPVLGLRAVSPGIANLPGNAESRRTAESIQTQFPLASTSPIEIVLEPRDGSMLDPNNLESYRKFSKDIAAIQGVQRVESLWGFLPAGFSARTLSTSFVLEPDLIEASRPFLTRNAALITVIPDPSLSSDDVHDLVRQMRTDLAGNAVPGMIVSVGGVIALDLDLLEHISSRVPIVLMWVLSLTAIALFVHLRSALLPIKAIVLNLASMGASFGMLVWIFQDGNLARFVGAETTGSTVMLLPVLMFCFMFGLGMDFEIIMLGRIREAWMQHGDTTRAVREGLERAAGIVTASAIVMLTVFLAFAFGELDVVKALGIGLAIAVVIDATIVRLLLLPATMQLMGSWNWWPTRRKRSEGDEPAPATLTTDSN